MAFVTPVVEHWLEREVIAGFNQHHLSYEPFSKMPLQLI